MNKYINCLKRDCGEIQVLLISVMLGFGGVLGGIMLGCQNGCGYSDSAEDADVTIKLEIEMDVGLEDGVDGAIVQAIALYILEAVADAADDSLRTTRKSVAGVCIFLSFLKKLGLKLILLIPLLLSNNTIPAMVFGIDLVVLVYFAYEQKYCPGSLYNEIHVLRTGKKFVKVRKTHVRLPPAVCARMTVLSPLRHRNFPSRISTSS